MPVYSNQKVLRSPAEQQALFCMGSLPRGLQSWSYISGASHLVHFRLISDSMSRRQVFLRRPHFLSPCIPRQALSGDAGLRFSSCFFFHFYFYCQLNGLVPQSVVVDFI